MYRPVTDRSGQVIGFEYADAQGRTQFVPAVGQAQGRPGPGGRLGALQRRQFDSPAFGGAAASPSAAPQFMFGGNVAPPAAPAPAAPQFGAQSAPERGAGGLYGKFAGKFRGMGDELRGNVEAMAGGEGLYPDDADYRRGDRLMKTDMRQAERDMLARQKAGAYFANPYYAVDGYGSMGTASQDYYRNQPLTQLTFLMQGAAGKDRFSDNAKRFSNAVNRTAGALGAGMAPSQDTLLQALFNPGVNSAVGRSFKTPTAGEARYDRAGIYQGTGRTQWDWAPATQQAEAMRSYLSAIYGTTARPSSQQPAMSYVNRLIDQWVAQNIGKRSPKPLYRWLSDRMGY